MVTALITCRPTGHVNIRFYVHRFCIYEIKGHLLRVVHKKDRLFQPNHNNFAPTCDCQDEPVQPPF